jgi:hypothetical protein
MKGRLTNDNGKNNLFFLKLSNFLEFVYFPFPWIGQVVNIALLSNLWWSIVQLPWIFEILGVNLVAPCPWSFFLEGNTMQGHNCNINLCYHTFATIHIDKTTLRNEESQILNNEGMLLFMILFERIYRPKEIKYDIWAKCTC